MAAALERGSRSQEEVLRHLLDQQTHYMRDNKQLQRQLQRQLRRQSTRHKEAMKEQSCRC